MFWKRALAVIIVTTGSSWAVHYWNESYRKAGQIHPITKFILEHRNDEKTLRDARNRDIEKNVVNRHQAMQSRIFIKRDDSSNPYLPPSRFSLILSMRGLD